MDHIPGHAVRRTVARRSAEALARAPSRADNLKLELQVGSDSEAPTADPATVRGAHVHVHVRCPHPGGACTGALDLRAQLPGRCSRVVTLTGSGRSAVFLLWQPART